MIKGSVQCEDITVINTYASNVAPYFIKQILLDPKVEKSSNTGIDGDFNTTLSLMDRSSK
jgi:hypothetical protein